MMIGIVLSLKIVQCVPTSCGDWAIIFRIKVLMIFLFFETFLAPLEDLSEEDTICCNMIPVSPPCERPFAGGRFPTVFASQQLSHRF